MHQILLMRIVNLGAVVEVAAGQMEAGSLEVGALGSFVLGGPKPSAFAVAELQEFAV